MFNKNDQPGPRRQRRIDRYQQLVEQISPKSDFGMGLLRAFWVGGTICMLGQALRYYAGISDGAFDGRRRV